MLSIETQQRVLMVCAVCRVGYVQFYVNIFV
jgi:hypothetical protein